MALVIITSPAATAPATAAAGAVVIILRCTWHLLQEQPGAGRRRCRGGGIQYRTWALNHASNCNTFSYLLCYYFV